MANIKAVSEGTFESEVLKADLPIVVDFWAPWCGPCKMLEPVLEALAEEFSGKVRFVKVDIDMYTHLASDFGIRSIPALLAFKDGNLISSVIGYRPKSEVKKFIEKLLP